MVGIHRSTNNAALKIKESDDFIKKIQTTRSHVIDNAALTQNNNQIVTAYLKGKLKSVKKIEERACNVCANVIENMPSCQSENCMGLLVCVIFLHMVVSCIIHLYIIILIYRINIDDVACMKENEQLTFFGGLAAFFYVLLTFVALSDGFVPAQLLNNVFLNLTSVSIYLSRCLNSGNAPDLGTPSNATLGVINELN